MRLNSQVFWALLFFALIVLAGHMFLADPDSIAVENRAIALDCAGDFSGFTKITFAQISDLHFTGGTKKETLDKITSEIAKISPAAVFITGDLISNGGGIEPASKLVSDISKTYSVYAVFGNWDYKTVNGDTGELKDALANSGAKTLENEAVELNAGNETMLLLGAADPYTSLNRSRDLEKALSVIGEKNRQNSSVRQCKILLAHSPDIMKAASEQNIDLVLAGHTHGGQIYIGNLTEKIIPATSDGKGYVRGLYKKGNTQMYVNRGIGTSVLPARFFASPEITAITLEKTENRRLKS